MININDSHINPELTFKRLVYLHMQQLTNFPYIEKDFDALTDYELLCLVVKYLNDVIKNSNEQNNSITNLYNAFLALQDYMNNSVQELEDAWNDKTTELETAFNNLQTWIDNYFDNLDVQEEINNKLDQMLKDGVLEQIIEQFIQSTALWCFDTVADMKSATNLINGSYAKTMGYYSLNDGGSSIYKIRNKTNDDVIDESFIISISDLLVAELIYNNEIKLKQLGCYEDATHDDTAKVNNLFTKLSSINRPMKIIVTGICYIDGQLTLLGASNNYLNSITISGISGTSNYSASDGIKCGFLFKSVYENYEYYDSFKIQYVNGLKLENLTFTTNETVTNGKLPFNANNGIVILNSGEPNIINCNVTKFFSGIKLSPTSGLAVIEHNNIALCNIGIQTSGAGDCSIINNHINTIGFDIYGLDGVIDEDYQEFYTNNHVWGIGIYVGGSGNITVSGGKIEWCNIGIWQDYANGMIYDNILFDRCSLTAIAITAHYKPYTSGIITNNIFYGCGGITPTATWQERHIGNNITGCSIGLSATNNIIVSNNKILGDNGSLIGSFKTDVRYYGPKAAAIICYLTANSSIVNNIINCDSQFSCNLLDTPIEFNNNIMNKDVYYNNNRVLTYKQNGNSKIYTCFNLDNVAFGNFNTNDIILKSSNPLEGWKVTSAGTKTTLNYNVDVITEGTEFYPGDKTVLELKNAYNNMNLNVGCIVSIAGVTGNKIITGIIEHSNKIYLKLNSACDVAVTNAHMTNVAPTFTPITL